MKRGNVLGFAAVLLIGISTAANGAVTRYYRFETNNGAVVSNGQTVTRADDSSGNNLHGTVVGSPQYATTPFANPLPGSGAANQLSYLSGTGNRVLLSGATAPILSPAFTVEAYFRLNSIDPNTGDVKSIIRVEDPTTGTGVFSLVCFNLVGGNGTNDLVAIMSNDTLELKRLDILPNTNYHVAATYDGTFAKLYLDGALVDSANFPGFTGSATIGGAIGNDTTIAGGITAFQGNIDEVRISDVALSPSQFLNAVPEPSSLWLLGLGGLALLRRHRLVSCAALIFIVPFFLLSTPPASAAPLYGTVAGNGLVQKVASNGTTSTFTSGMVYPEGLALDSVGSLYIADWGNGTIRKITAGGTISTFASGIQNPHDLEFDSVGNLYVATDQNGGTISKFTTGGTGSIFKTGLSFPHFMAFDQLNNLYFSNEGSTTISKITPGGTVSTFATGMSEPGDMVFDSLGNLYVLNHGDDTIKKVLPNGNVSNFAAGLSNLGPVALAIDDSDNLYFNLGNNFTVSRLTPSGDLSTYATGAFNYWDLIVGVPEPSSLWLLGLGGVALMRRRRQCCTNWNS